jgi:hypothetical protein
MAFRTMPRAMIELGYRIMEGTIRRDWNSPSVFAWLLGNECRLTVEYLREGKERCRKLDPLARPVSFANDRNKEEAKPIYEQAGMDFFDQHIYTFDIERFRKEAEYFGASRPFTVSEWGAREWGQSQVVMQKTVDLLIDLEAEGKLSGCSFWEWADMRQFSGEEIATLNGVLEEGVVTESRQPRGDVYLQLQRLFEGRRYLEHPAHARPTVLPLRWGPATPGASFHTVDLQALVESAEGVRAWVGLEVALAKFWPGVPMAEDQWKRTGKKFLLWQGSDLTITGIPFRIPVVNGYALPALLTPEVPEVTISVGQECERLHILGQVTFPVGYPVVGKRGEKVATYRMRYSGGREREVPVRNGMEAAQSNRIHVASRIDAVATGTQRALEYVKDVVREQYQVLLWSLPVERGRVESVRCKLEAGRPALAIFAITAEHVEQDAEKPV